MIRPWIVHGLTTTPLEKVFPSNYSVFTHKECMARNRNTREVIVLPKTIAIFICWAGVCWR